MICKNCGQNMPDGTHFCTNCGADMSPQPGSMPGAMPMGNQYQPAPQKKSKKPLIIGLSIGGAVLVAAIIVVCILVFGSKAKETSADINAANVEQPATELVTEEPLTKTEELASQFDTVSDLKSCDYSLSLSSSSGENAGVNGSFSLGSGLRDTSFYINIQGMEMAYANDRIAIKQMSPDGTYGYSYMDGIIAQLESAISQSTGMDIDLDDLLSGNSMTQESLMNMLGTVDLDDILEGSLDEYYEQSENGDIILLVKSYIESFDDTDDFLDLFLQSYEHTDSYTDMSISINDIALSFLDYIEAQASGTDEALKQAANNVMLMIGEDSSWEDVKDEIRESPDISIHAKIKCDGDNFNGISLELNSSEGDYLNFDLEFSNHGSPTMSSSQIEAFIDEAQQNM